MASTNPHLLDFDLETLRQLGNGAVFNQIMRLIEQCVDDCQRRPGEKRPRKVMIQLNISPKSHDEAGIDEDTVRKVADGIELMVTADNKLPNRKSMSFDCGIGPGNKILFNPYNPVNHRQLPLPVVLDQKQAAAGDK